MEMRDIHDINVKAKLNLDVDIDPLDAISEIRKSIFGPYWIEKTEDGRYVLMEEISAGQHSFDREIKEVDEELYQIQEGLNKTEKYISEGRE